MDKSTDKIERKILEEALETKSLGRRLFFYEQLDSTNAQAKRLIKEITGADNSKEQENTELTRRADSLNGTLILAEEQTAGRGRQERGWSSPKEGGIYMSFILRPNLPAMSCPMLTLVAAIAVNEAIGRVSGLESLIKWPNDIVINGKKVCGILTETTGLLSEGPNIILGIGINANRKDFPEELKINATSIAKEKGSDINSYLLVAEICNSLERYYDKFAARGDLTLLKQDYEKHLVNKGKQVRILEKEGEYLGIALGISEQGALLVETEEKEIKTIVSGEVSVRGILGYI